MKQCSRCKETLQLSSFYRKQNGHSSQCKLCLRVKNQKRYLENRESIKEQTLEYYKANKEVILKKEAEKRNNNSTEQKQKIAEYQKQYREANKERISKVRKEWYTATAATRRDYSRKYIKEWNEKNKHIVVWCTLLTTCFNRLKTKKTDKTQEQLGYSHKNLKDRMENYFEEGMSWDNHGTVWSVHHNIPVTWFTPETPASIVSHLDNLYPVTTKLNSSISNKEILYPVVSNYKKQVKQWLLEAYLPILDTNEHRDS